MTLRLRWLGRLVFLLVLGQFHHILPVSGQSGLAGVRSGRHRPGLRYAKALNKEEGAIRLVGGRNEYEGNIEVLHNNKWGSVCDDEWDATEGRIVCEQLGFPGLEKVTHSSFFGLARRRYWMDNMFCQGPELELTDCHFEGWGVNDCEPSEAAGVICRSPLDQSLVQQSEDEVEPEFYQPKSRINSRENLEVRLRGGRSPNEGRVEVRFTPGGHWGTICSDGWSLLEANVVCHQLRQGYARAAMQTDYFGGAEVVPVVLSGTECFGNETNLMDCLHHDHLRSVKSCHRSPNNGGRHVAVVICDRLAPDLILDYYEIERTAHLEDRAMLWLQCAMEENCLSNEAYEIQRDDPDWRYSTRRLLKFTVSTMNTGTSDFLPFKDKSLWEWHMCHKHYHSMEVFATFDVYDLMGRKVAQGHKASFCLEDNLCIHGVEKKYNCKDFGDQGITVNCADVYRFDLDCQWVDITELDTGRYILKVAVNPEFKVSEMSFENNAAICDLHYSDTYARVMNCRLQRP